MPHYWGCRAESDLPGLSLPERSCMTAASASAAPDHCDGMGTLTTKAGQHTNKVIYSGLSTVPHSRDYLSSP